MCRQIPCLLVLASVLPLFADDAPAPKTAKEALQPFNDLIGSWRCTGTPSGSLDNQQKNFWTETLAIEWQFKGGDAWLKLDFSQPKDAKVRSPFAKGELRYRPATKDYELKLQTSAKESVAYTGAFNQRSLALERRDGDTIHRLTFALLHANRFTYSYSTRPANKSLISAHWKVGATKEGESFAIGETGPECVVTGGKGTMTVSFQGKTYYVCCSGCRDEFLESPKKYIAEYEAKRAKKSK